MAFTTTTATCTAMEQSPKASKQRDHHHRHNHHNHELREWSLRSQISGENTKSRRFSGSYIRSYREDIACRSSFRSNFTISSTASSPGYPLKDEIDPSTYSFTTALKALQERAGYNGWECLSPEGFALNSKWNEAEKYISNPLSGEVPMECLSAKTLSGRSFRSSTINRITMSAPLVYSSSRQSFNKTPPSVATPGHDVASAHLHVQGKKMEGMTTRDVGTQSTPPELSSGSSSSPASSTPPIIERSLKKFELAQCGDSPNYSEKLKVKEVEEKDTTKGKEESEKEKTKKNQIWRSSMQGGCLSWMRKRHKEKHKSAKKNIFLLKLEGC